MKRRAFLRGMGWAAAGVTAVAVLPCCGVLPALPTKRTPELEEVVAAWVQVLPNGRVRLYSPRQEMGQGISIGFSQIVAEELDLPVHRIDLVLPRTDELPDPVSSTVGSQSIQDRMRLVASAAAQVREALRRRAAELLGAPPSQLSLADGAFAGRDGRTVDYARLAGQRVEILEGDDAPVLRSFAPAARRRHVGREAACRDLERLVAGAPLFVDDVRLPGLLHGAFVRGPVIGASARRADFGRARALPGFVLGDRFDGRVGIVARHRHQLRAIAAAVDVEWDRPTPFDDASVARAIDVDRKLAAGDLQHELADDSVDRGGRWDLDMRIDVPFAAHATIEPRCAVVEPQGDDRYRVHAATQDAYLVRKKVARAVGAGESDVAVRSYRMGGGFGSRALPLVEQEAAVLAKAAGAPVKVRWTRAEEFHEGFHRPPSSHRIRVRLRNGRVADWWHAFATGHVFFTHAGAPRWVLGFATLGSDKGASRGAVPPYAFARRRIEFRDEPLPIRTGPWRGLNAGPNALAIEVAMSRAARLAGQDAVEFRLAHLAEAPRLARCLERAAALAGWSTSARGALDDGSQLGVGCGIYKGVTYVAAVARVARSAARLRVTDVWCVQDCGLVVNPDRVRAQIEGNAMWAVSSVLCEKLEVGPGQVAASTFAQSPVLRLDASPRVHSELIAADDQAPTGAGESAITAAMGAVANAWERASGIDLERIPVGA